MQDTTKLNPVVPTDSLKHPTDSSLQHAALQKDTLPSYHKPYRQTDNMKTVVDTTAVCRRNVIADITFYDSLNIITKGKLIKTDRFPFLFTEKNIERELVTRASLIHHLKSGKRIPAKPFHDDWLLGFLLFGAFIYSLIRITSKRLIPEVTRFFLFRGINDSVSHDIGGLFNWQATLLNLITFFNIGLFAYYAAEWYGIIPSGLSGITVWLISVGIIIIAVTLRHFVCVITGAISGERELFREYLFIVYQSYRFSAIILFIIVILISYTHIFPVNFLIISGFFASILMLIIRMARLILIFINRNISIFYLILYLCSLEIMPFLVLLKYSADLF